MRAAVYLRWVFLPFDFYFLFVLFCLEETNLFVLMTEIHKRQPAWGNSFPKPTLCCADETGGRDEGRSPSEARGRARWILIILQDCLHFYWRESNVLANIVRALAALQAWWLTQEIKGVRGWKIWGQKQPWPDGLFSHSEARRGHGAPGDPCRFHRQLCIWHESREIQNRWRSWSLLKQEGDYNQHFRTLSFQSGAEWACAGWEGQGAARWACIGIPHGFDVLSAQRLSEGSQLWVQVAFIDLLVIDLILSVSACKLDCSEPCYARRHHPSPWLLSPSADPKNHSLSTSLQIRYFVVYKIHLKSAAGTQVFSARCLKLGSAVKYIHSCCALYCN